MTAISDTHHVSPECDLRTGCPAIWRKNPHQPRVIPLAGASTGFDPDSTSSKEPEQPPRVPHRTSLRDRIEQEVLAEIKMVCCRGVAYGLFDRSSADAYRQDECR